MKSFFGYIRVSTARQGEHGVSLQEQRDAISRHAARSGIEITRWFEERETAAKRGRPIFEEMMKLLKQKRAEGVLFHKIDRSVRNLHDWTKLGDASDGNIGVQFVTEGLDLTTTSGRLAADVQAVVAAHFIRNLRDESRKGFYGRLKQGLYPLPAPVGYVDRGKGKPKEIDPEKGPIVRQAFELYASGRFSLESLKQKITRLGLRNRNRGCVSVAGLSGLLNNPFYIGIIRLRSTGETFQGVHDPLISTALFRKVQAILRGKYHRKVQSHDFPFRRLFTCHRCGFMLTGELQKGHVYYRCHHERCTGASVREEHVEAAVRDLLRSIALRDDERQFLQTKGHEFTVQWQAARRAAIESVQLGIERLKSRLVRLTDAFLDESIDKAVFEERKATLLMERKDYQERLANLANESAGSVKEYSKFFELAGSAYLLYESALPEEKRKIVALVTSNRVVNGNNVAFTLVPALQHLADSAGVTKCTPYRNRLRTLTTMFDTQMQQTDQKKLDFPEAA